MNKIALIAAALLAIALSCTSAHAQAFGVTRGMKIEQFDIIGSHPKIANSYFINPPAPNPLFETYIVTAGPNVGACGIIAQTAYSADAEKTIATHGTVLAALTQRYGEPSEQKGYIAGWLNPVSDVAAILLRPAAEDSMASDRRTGVLLAYTFYEDNDKLCVEDASGQTGNGL